MPIRLTKLLVCILFLTMLSGCAVTHTPDGWLPDSASRLQNEAFGSWIELHYKHRNRNEFQTGELIAVQSDSLFVLSNDTLLYGIAQNDITKARLVEYNAHAGRLSGWVVLGSVSTITHGFWLVFSAPLLWILGGSLAVGARTHDPLIDYPQKSLKSFRAFARFPQGIPKNLDRKELIPKSGF